MPPTPIPFPNWTPAEGLVPLTVSEGVELAARLPVTPYYVVCYGGLRAGLDRAFVSGDRSDPDAVIVQHRLSPQEPEYFGRDPEAGWRILARIPGWTCVNASAPDAEALAKIFARELPEPFRPIGDLFYTLESPPTAPANPAVRLAGPADVPLLERFDAPVWGSSYRTFEEIVTDGIVAIAIEEGRVVSVALLTATNGRFGDVGVHTLEPFRRRGYSAAAASWVAREVQARGITPIWSTGSHNLASQRVAAKVGFQPVGRWAYLVSDHLEAAGGYRPDYGRKTHAAMQTP